MSPSTPPRLDTSRFEFNVKVRGFLFYRRLNMNVQQRAAHDKQQRLFVRAAARGLLMGVSEVRLAELAGLARNRKTTLAGIAAASVRRVETKINGRPYYVRHRKAETLRAMKRAAKLAVAAKGTKK